MDTIKLLKYQKENLSKWEDTMMPDSKVQCCKDVKSLQINLNI